MTKQVVTLNVDGYAPAVTALTFPLLAAYAEKIGADFRVITTRKWPEAPPVYEKLQLYEMAAERDWTIYFDADALVHPDMPDVTEHIGKDTVMFNGADLASNRITYDRFFRRDGRNIGACNWFTVASDWCRELWEPLSDITIHEAIARIHPTVNERGNVVTADHLIDDFVLSRNIAKYGLKHARWTQVLTSIGQGGTIYLWHEYTMPVDEKVVAIRKTLVDWHLRVGKT